jgi:hypothetical protein
MKSSIERKLLCRHISHKQNQSRVIRLWPSMSFYLSNPALPLKQDSRPPYRIDIHMCKMSLFNPRLFTASTKTFNNEPINCKLKLYMLLFFRADQLYIVF